LKDLYITEDVKPKYMLGGALHAGAKAFGANDTIANSLGAIGGLAESFTFNPVGGAMETARFATPLAKDILAYGGYRKMYGNGGFTEFNGATHEEGGVQLPAFEVEDKETMYNDYIFSNRVTMPKSKLTYAEKSKFIRSKYSKRPDDKMSAESMDRELNALMQAQESDAKILKGREKFGYGKAAYGLDKDPRKRHNSVNLGIEPISTIPFSGFEDTYRNGFLQDEPKYLKKEAPVFHPNFYNGLPYRSEKGTYTTPLSSRNYPIDNSTPIYNPNTNPFGNDLTSKPSVYGPTVQEPDLTTLFNLDNPGNKLKTTVTPGVTPPSNLNMSSGIYGVPSNIEYLNSKIGSMPVMSTSNTQSSTSTPFSYPKISPAGAVLNSIGPVSQLAGTLINGVDKTKFDRIKPSLVNYDPAIGAATKAAGDAYATSREGIVNNARNSGQLLSNLVTSRSSIGSNLGKQVADINMQEGNINSQIMNQTNAQNAGIQMQEQIANEQNKAAYRQAIYGALTDLGNVGAGYLKDNALLKGQTISDQRTLSMLSSLPGRYEWVMDENNNPVLKLK
jgi:hypothetical protein